MSFDCFDADYLDFLNLSFIFSYAEFKTKKSN